MMVLIGHDGSDLVAYIDADGDGYTEQQGDCDDNPLINPAATEIVGDGIDRTVMVQT